MTNPEILKAEVVQDVLRILSERNLRLRLVGDRLSVRGPKHHLTPAVRALLEEHKGDLLSLLREKTPAVNADDVGTVSEENGVRQLSFAQERLWFLNQLEGPSPTYNLPIVLRLKGKLNVDALRWALNQIVTRHEVLSTVFPEVNGQPQQVVRKELSLEIPLINLNATDDAAIERYLYDEAERPFDLARGPLLRGTLLQIDAEEFIFLLTCHHIVSDGWSFAILVREFSCLYEARCSGRETKLPPLPIQYRDYSAQQRQRLRGEVLERHLSYWKLRLQDAPQLLSLPTDRPPPAVQTFRGATEPIVVPRSISEALLRLSQRENATLFITLLTAFNVLLFRYTGQEDIVIGSSIAGRTRAETENLIGFFVNALVLRTDLSGVPTFRELLARVRKDTLEAYSHQEVPFQLIVDALQLPRSLDHSPIFQVMFDLQNTPNPRLELPDLTITPFERKRDVAKFDLTLALHEEDHGLVGSLEYNVDLFDQNTVQRMAQHFKQLLVAVVENPDQKITHLQCLTGEEINTALLSWNETKEDYPQNKRVHQLFEVQAKLTPDFVAATCEEQSITYRELNRKTNAIANALRAKGIGTDQKVALFMDRDLDYLSAMLGVLKASGAFVPVDLDLPENHNVAIIEECRPSLIVATESRLSLVQALAGDSKVVSFEDLSRSGDPATAPPDNSYHNSLAYVMYTSGSTGRPKGVMIEHEGMTNHITAHIRRRKFTENDVVGQIARTTFDVSVWQFLCALLVGGRTAIIPGEKAWEPSQLLRAIMDQGVTILQTVPSHTNVILDEMEANPGKYSLNSLRYYMTHAEALTTAQCIRWFRNNPGVPMINGYGATEVSDDSSHLLLEECPRSERPTIPIHGVFPNLQHYVLDQALNPPPIGVCGEIYIGGIGVGRGYLDDPQRTAAMFVPDPFSSKPGARLYRVGDLGRYLSDGSIEFAGRTDFQIRVRGFRVEIGEIETVLGRHPEVKRCVVVPKKAARGETALVGYLVPEKYPGPATSQLKSYLAEHLPQHMIPSCFITLDALPLSANGKVSRKDLPEPPEHDLSLEDYTPPRNELEARLAKLWEEALGVKRVGIRDNFFRLGGHSLIAAALVIKLRAELDADISIRNLFEAPTIESFLERIDRPLDISPQMLRERKASIEALSSVRHLPAPEYFPLAPAQIPVWYACVMAPESIVYHVNYSTDLFLRGTLDLPCFVRAWQAFFDRHVSFRMRFTTRDGHPVQHIGPAIVLRQEEIYLDRTSVPATDRVAEAERLATEFGDVAFDLENGPLFRLRLADYGEGQYQILFVTHHIIWDERSMMNMFDELTELYNAFLSGRVPALPEIEINYPDYVRWIRECVASGAFEEHKSYWLDMYRTMPPGLDLATDFPRPSVQTYNGAWVFSWLPRNTARRLASYLLEHNVTLFMFMLAVIDLYFHRITGQDDLVIGCPIDGRDHESFKPLIGLFATPMPIRCQIVPGMTFRELLQQAADRSVGAYEHHYYPCSNLIEDLPHTKDLSRPRLFSIMYGVQHNKTETVNALKLQGLEPNRLDLHREDFHAGARFDLNLIVDQWATDISVNCIYNTDLFRKTSVERMMKELLGLVEGVLEDSDRHLSAYDLLLDREQLLDQFNQTAELYDENITLSELFERQVEKSPQQIAVSFDKQAITYEALNRRANQLARFLAENGVQARKPVAVLLPASPDFLVTVLAILKLGAYYVPLSQEYPAQRVIDICDNVQATHLITDAAGDWLHLNSNTTIVALAENSSLLSRYETFNLECAIESNALAYVIYTSGTTGTPKGIPIRHQGVVNLLTSTQKEHQLAPTDRILFLTPPTFDASILDIFWPLSYGSTIVIPDAGRIKDPVRLGQMLSEKNVTIFQCVPVMLKSLVDARNADEFAAPKSLRLIICGGAAMTRRLRDECLATFDCRLMNHYGPTEITVDAARFDCSKDFDGDVAPIGKPIANTKLFILDKEFRPLPIGVVGEICISSPGVTPGYIEDEGPNQSFISLTLNDQRLELYRTGDLGKFGEDGTIYFIGRKDKQVKVRGNRVELDEVAHALLQHSEIKNTVVRHVDNGAGESRLVAFVEFREELNTFAAGDESYRLFTLAQRPELAKSSNLLHMDAWPRYFQGDKTLQTYWPRLNQDFPEYQFVLTDRDDLVVAAGNAVPIYWDGSIAGLPAGWDEGLERAFAGATSGGVANTFFILAGVVAQTHRNKGLSSCLIKGFKALAKGFAFEKVLVAVRPTGKTDHPELDFDIWCNTRREDGLLADNWLRMHEVAGGEILKLCERSQLVEGSFAEWLEWTGVDLSAGQSITETLQAPEIDAARRVARYYDPSVWVEHFYRTGDTSNWFHVSKHALRTYLGSRLPDYMVPDQYRFLSRVPLTESGKIDENSKLLITNQTYTEPVLPRTDLQKRLTEIWSRVLSTESFGVTDDFFELGGQSLKVIQMLAKVEQACGVKVELCDFYKDSTVQGLEQLLYASNSNGGCEAVR